MSAIEPMTETRHPALADAGVRVLLSGNEAIARGA
jgi:hypothetical protein